MGLVSTCLDFASESLGLRSEGRPALLPSYNCPFDCILCGGFLASNLALHHVLTGLEGSPLLCLLVLFLLMVFGPISRTFCSDHWSLAAECELLPSSFFFCFFFCLQHESVVVLCRTQVSVIAIRPLHLKHLFVFVPIDCSLDPAAAGGLPIFGRRGSGVTGLCAIFVGRLGVVGM